VRDIDHFTIARNEKWVISLNPPSFEDRISKFIAQGNYAEVLRMIEEALSVDKYTEQAAFY
jgi:hypothetical protein